VTIPTLTPDDERQPERLFSFIANTYNQYYLNQLYELLSEYGPIHEVWFDGANPNPGVQETYNYADWFELVRTLAPQAVMFNGPDVRWVGNEAGSGRETEWSVLPFQGDPAPGIRTLDPLQGDLGSRERLLAGPDNQPWSYLAWSPAEMDVSIRPGWFYHPEEDGQVKSLDHLLVIYYASVGRNGALLLNIPPDRRGLFAELDVQRLNEFGKALRRIFAHDLTSGCSIRASSSASGSPVNCVDGNPDTFWMAEEKDRQPELTLEFEKSVMFDQIVLQESLDVGQRVEKFSVEAWNGETWQSIAEGTTIGYKRILRCRLTSSWWVRVRLLQSRLSPGVASVSLFLDR
jgi:alpha-L-fucosidase